MATITITVPDAQVPRIRDAFANQAGVDPATYTAEDMRQAIIAFIKSVVRNVEVNAALRQIDADADALRNAFVPDPDPNLT